jgi:hypothetical protein
MVGDLISTPYKIFQVSLSSFTRDALNGIALNSGDVNLILGAYDEGTFTNYNVGSIQVTENNNSTDPYKLALNPRGGDVYIGSSIDNMYIYTASTIFDNNISVGSDYPYINGLQLFTQNPDGLHGIAVNYDDVNIIMGNYDDGGFNFTNTGSIQVTAQYSTFVPYSLVLNPRGGDVYIGSTTATFKILSNTIAYNTITLDTLTGMNANSSLIYNINSLQGQNGTIEFPFTNINMKNNSINNVANISCIALTVNGTAKPFIIDHPTKSDKYLIHACIEGPEAGVYYRGTTNIENEYVEVNLPEYVNTLAYDFTVNVTPVYNGSKIRSCNISDVTNGSFRIYGEPGKVHWTVMGKRGDIDIEKDKSSTTVNRFGPYTWV